MFFLRYPEIAGILVGFVAASPTFALGQESEQEPPSLSAPVVIEPEVELPDLKPIIDESVRWLRSVQDTESGRYGESVQETAWVLKVLAKSPRKYRRHDGPFMSRALDYLKSRQAPNGSIHDVGIEEEQIFVQTFWCVSTLRVFDDPESQRVLKAAEEFLGPIPSGVQTPTREESLKLAGMTLEERQPDGQWDGQAGKVMSTAIAIHRLSAAWEILEAEKEDTSAKVISRLPAFEEVDRERALDAIAKGSRFLLRAGEGARWGAPGRPDAGLSAMVLGALQSLPAPRDEELQRAIDEGLAWLVSLQRADGSIHDGKLANYTTSAAILALARARKPEYAKVILRARDFLLALQADEGEGYSEGDLYYGGIGYGGDERPDLSNLQMSLEALRASGLEADNPAFERALAFLERCQNRSESNDTRITTDGTTIVSGEDGGASYMPGNSPAGYIELADGRKVPRSYGSMTYALLKSLIFAGLPKEDPRMQAAWKWLKQNYTLDINPGFEFASNTGAAYQGLFYYFLTMAQALDLYGEEAIVTADGRSHPWRSELCGRLVVMQDPRTGSWVNENSPRWWEGNPVLATAYALLALDAALPEAGN